MTNTPGNPPPSGDPYGANQDQPHISGPPPFGGAPPPPPAGTGPIGPYPPPPPQMDGYQNSPASGGPHQNPPVSGGPFHGPPTSGGPHQPPPPIDPYQAPPMSGAPYQPDPYQNPPTFGGPFQPPVSSQPYQQPGGQFTQPFPAPPPPRQRRTRLIVSLIVVGAVLLLGGGGITAFFVLRDSGGDAQPSPTEATVNFLTAVYKDRDAAKASKYVCSAARDEKVVAKKIKELTDYEANYKQSPRFTWDEPKVESSSKKNAKVSVTIRFNSDDDRSATQRLEITAINDDGWFVCDIATKS